MKLKSVNYVDSYYDVEIIYMSDPDDFIGRNTIIVKRAGLWPVVVKWREQKIAELDQIGSTVRLLAVAGTWMVIG